MNPRHSGKLFNKLHVGDGKTGRYQMYVHGRENEPCPRCSSPIRKEEISSHQTYFCPRCQY
ncbi:zinc finger domain-containing protein [Heyndrickxia faecalis]|uniref:zinc finger domain-containing protein n=1 Tax=Heyndrickxia faecalis TaxID=2824910 RepID=UPI003D214CC2